MSLTVAFFSRNVDDAMAVLRVLGPAEASGMHVLRGVEKSSVHYELVNEADVVVIQRDFCRDLDAYEKIRDQAHAAQKPLIMDIDDLLLDLPTSHPDRINLYYTDALLPMLQAIIEADLVTVPTPALREQLLSYNKNIKVFQNYLLDNWWSLSEPRERPAQAGEITLGYMGGHTHMPDLLHILPALAGMLVKYKPKIKLRFWGIQAPTELADFSQSDWCPPKSYAYRDFADYFQTQYADIMIAPLLDTPFNHCKSCIKYLEYSALGVPGVYSQVTPYSSVIEDGVDGLLASTLQEWEQALSKLIEQPRLRTSMALNAQKKVRHAWLLSQHASNLEEIYASAIKELPAQTHPLPSFYDALKTYTRQIYEGSQYHNHQILHLVEQNAQLTAQLSQSEEENIDYALSTSWLLTRPMRKISGKLKGIR